MSIEAGDPSVHYPQSGVVPFRMANTEVEILLITTNSGKHWTIPKGLIEDGMSATESALQEAYEEAGIRGQIHETSIGRYQYHKWGGTCEVEVFLMTVTQMLDDWPEHFIRDRLWKNIDDAATIVKHKGLRTILSRLKPTIHNLFPHPADG